MDDILRYFSSHPLAIMALLFVVVVFLYFLLKQFVKMVLGVLIMLLVLAGYFYFKDPHRVWENMKATLQTAWKQRGKVVETGKGAYREGKQLYEKGKELPGDLEKALKKRRETTTGK